MADKPDKSNKLKARLPRGLADRGPAEIAATRRMIETIRAVYERYGFEPVETPAIEYTDALGKFLPDQDRPNEGVFSFQDDDEQWLSLRYDLTAPLARYVAENFDTLPKPYRSYRDGWVFRNEKPGPGRFRQFMQFDADTVGSRVDGRRCRDVHDGGGHDGGARHSARQLCGEGEQPQGARWRDGVRSDSAAKRMPASGSRCLRAIDKFDRLGVDGCQSVAWRQAARMKAAISPKGRVLIDSQIDSSHRTLRCWGRTRLGAESIASANEVTLANFESAVQVERARRSGRRQNSARSRILVEALRATMMAGFVIDPSVVRGLEYYTGPVYEVELLLETKDEKGRPVRFGSVGGGGRYDGLVSRFRGEPVPATGFSIGVSRLQAALTLIGKLDAKPAPGPVVVTVFDRDRIADYQQHGRAAAQRRHPRRALSRQSEEQCRPAAQIRRQARLALRRDPGRRREGQGRGADQGPDPRRRDRRASQGPRRLSEEAGRGAVRRAGGRAGRGRAQGAGPPRHPWS